MLPLTSVSNLVVFEIGFSCPIVPTDLLEFKVIFCDETLGWSYSELDWCYLLGYSGAVGVGGIHLS